HIPLNGCGFFQGRDVSMALDRYSRLLADVCREAGIQDDEEVALSGQLTVGDVPVSLIHGEEIGSCGLVMYTELCMPAFGSEIRTERAASTAALLNRVLHAKAASLQTRQGTQATNG